MSKYPVLSLVIPTWNRKPVLNKILNSLTKQNFKRPFEIIICDSNSKDGTKELMLRYNNYPNLIIKYFNLANNISIKRNFGLKYAKSNNIVFLDDDCVPEKNYIDKYFKLLNNSDDKSIYCGIVKFPKQKLFQNYYKYRQSRHFLKYDQNYLDENTIVTMNMGIKRSLISKKNLYFKKSLGILGKNLNGFEDYEFAFRLKKQNIKIKKCDCTIFHLDERDLKQHAKKYFVFGKDTIHKLEQVNYEACKNNIFFKLKNSFLIRLIIKNTFLLKIMLFISNRIIDYNEKSNNLGFIYFKFVLLSYFVYGLSIKNNVK
tara:strand:- start:4720 stop:5664 length:945 start_codon:yes stop_codon:yes gene_type:complete